MMWSIADFDLKKFFLRWRMYLLAVVVAAVAVAILWCVPPWQVEQVRVRLNEPADEYRLATLENECRRTLLQGIGGFFLLAGLYVAWRRVKAAEEGQITERFTRAIDQLGQNGPDKMAIRLGGIYALERIAKDSEKDHGPIMEVLTTYVRQNAPVPREDPEKGPEEELWEEEPTLESAWLTADLQAILTVIGRRETTGNHRRNDPLNLTSARLYGANMRGANLCGVRLNFADLRFADLREADLRGAELERADLDRTDLRGAKNLTENQVRETNNFKRAFLPEHLAHLEEDPPVA